MTGIFLQVRLDSERLPRKALLPVCGKTVIEHAMESLRKVYADIRVVLTDKESSYELRPLAEKWGFDLFVGHHSNVLKRYADAVNYYDVDLVVRATGDNPLVSSELANRLITIHEKEQADYSGFKGMPLGTGVEVARADAILKAHDEAIHQFDREHVMPYLYKNPGMFKLFFPLVDTELRDTSRVTLDTWEDYSWILEIYKNLYKGRSISLEKLVRWLKENHVPESQRLVVG